MSDYDQQTAESYREYMTEVALDKGLDPQSVRNVDWASIFAGEPRDFTAAEIFAAGYFTT